MVNRYINNDKWGKVVSRIIRARMVESDISYEQLRVKLLALETDLTVDNLRSKVSKGILGTQLFLQILYVLDSQVPKKSEIDALIKKVEND